MHGVLIDARSQHGLTVTADEGTQANLGTARVDAQGVAQVEGALTADASTDSAEQPAGDTLESRHADLKQLEAAAQAAQEELLQANSMTQTIRSKHATEIQQLIALVKPFEQESEKLQQSAQTGWRLVLGGFVLVSMVLLYIGLCCWVSETSVENTHLRARPGRSRGVWAAVFGSSKDKRF